MIVGTPGDDVIIGTNGSDTICGLGGNDVIEAGNGDDRIDGGNGDDVILTGNGKDEVHGGSGNDDLSLGNGKDTAFAGTGVDIVDGGNGEDDCSDAETVSACETETTTLPCPATPELAVTSHDDGEAVDTSEAGNGTGSFFLNGVASSGTSALTVDVDGEVGVATLTPGDCVTTWTIEAQVPFTETNVYELAAVGDFETQTASLTLDVVAPGDDDVLIAPAFANTPQLIDRLVSFDAVTGGLVFTGDATSQLDIGAGLVSGPLDIAPDGYLKIVLGVEYDGQNTIVTTRQAGLTEYVRQIDIEISVEQGQNEPLTFQTDNPPAPVVVPGGGGFSVPKVLNLGPLLQQVDNSSDFDFEADFNFDPGFDIDIDIEFKRDGCTWCLPSVVVNRILFEVDIAISASAEVTYRGANLFEGGDSFGPRLDDFRLGTFVIPLPIGAITINLEAEGQAFYEFTADAAVRLEYGLTINLLAGYEYRGDGTGAGTYRSADFDGGLLEDGLELKAGIAATVAVGIEMDLEALFWGQAGFEIEATPKIELEAFADLVSQSVPWKLQLVVPFEAGLEVEIDLGPIQYDEEFGNLNFAQITLTLFEGVFEFDNDPTDDVVGDNVTVVDSDVVGSTEQWGKVDGFVPGESTWVLSTGRISDAVGPPSKFASTDLGLPGDQSLSTLSGFATYDAASYTTTVVPDLGTLNVRYAFASEEYPEYVGSSFNDVMAVFIDGVNCALVPGTQIPVAINTVNAGSFANFYVDNSTGAAGYGTSMDGITTPLTCSVPVNPGEPVTIKIAVADASDGVYDSAVALLDGGIWSS